MSGSTHHAPGRAAGRRRNPWLRLGLFTVAGALFVLGYWWGNQYKRPGTVQVASAILLRPPLALPDFTLTDQRGKPLDRHRLEGGWSLLLPGAAVGPATRDGLALMSQVYNRLADRPALQKGLRMLLVSPDPVERLADTVRGYNPELVAATGTKAELDRLNAALGADGGAAALFLISPRAELYALFTVGQKPADIAADIRQIMDADTP